MRPYALSFTDALMRISHWFSAENAGPNECPFSAFAGGEGMNR